MKAVAMTIRFRGGGSNPGPLSSPKGPKGASTRSVLFVCQSRVLARGWALVTVIAEVARPGASLGRAPPGAAPDAADASA
ncbi:hypothetical protein THAOC_30537, partial [Thalassiosira oceanica]